MDLHIREIAMLGRSHASFAELVVQFDALQIQQITGQLGMVCPPWASEVPELGYDIPTLADDVAALIRELDATSVVVVGHSMGGHVAVALASRHPGLVSKVVMVESTLIDPPEELRASLRDLVESFTGPDGGDVRRGFIEQSLFLNPDDRTADR